MTVEATIPSKSYPYVGVGQYDFDFLTYQESDIRVYHVDDEGETAVLAQGLDYTVTLSTVSDGGFIDVVNAIITGGTLTIRRTLIVEQPVDWVNGGPFNMDLLERSMDRIVMMMQQLDVTVEQGAVVTNWRGNWAGPGVNYLALDIITAPNGNWYSCQVANVSSASFDADLAAGYWLLALDVERIEELAAEAQASADAAALSETNAATSASSASSSASAASSYVSQAATHEANSAVNAQNASNCNQAAFEEAERAEAAADSIDYAKLVHQDSITGGAYIPGGTVAERPTPVVGQQRYVTDLETDTVMEWWNGVEWTSLGGGGGGGIVPAEPVETTDFTAEIGLHYPVDTSGGDVIVTPPSTPEAGDWFQLRDAGDTWTNATACYVDGLCHGDAEGLKLNNLNGSFFLQYQDATDGWVLVDGIGESGSAGPEDTGSITEIWSGSAGDGANISWSLPLSGFDAILFNFVATVPDYIGVDANAIALPSRLQVATQTALFSATGTGTSASSASPIVRSVTETSLIYRDTGSWTSSLTGIYGIKYGSA